MAIEQLHRKSWNLEFWIIEDADLEEEIWSLRRFSRRDLVLNITTGSLRKGPGVWADMQVVSSFGNGSYSPPIPQSDVTGLAAALAARLADNAPTYLFSTNTDTENTDPVGGAIRFNDTDISAVTEIALSASMNGVDKGDLFTNMSGILRGRVVGTRATFEFRITGTPTFNYWTRIPVTYLKGSKPADLVECAIDFLPANGTYLPLAGGTMASLAKILWPTNAGIEEGDNGSGDPQGLGLRCSLDYFLGWQLGNLSAFEADKVTPRPIYLPSGVHFPTGLRTVNDDTLTLLTTDRTIIALGSDPTAVNDDGSMLTGHELHLNNSSTGTMTFNPDSGSAIAIPPRGSAILRHRGSGLWVDLLAGKGDVSVDGVVLTAPATVILTGTCDSAGKAYADLTAGPPVLSSATLINAYTTAINQAPNFDFRIRKDDIDDYIVDFLNDAGDAVAEGTPYVLIFIGQKE